MFKKLLANSDITIGINASMKKFDTIHDYDDPVNFEFEEPDDLREFFED